MVGREMRLGRICLQHRDGEYLHMEICGGGISQKPLARRNATV